MAKASESTCLQACSLLPCWCLAWFGPVMAGSRFASRSMKVLPGQRVARGKNHNDSSGQNMELSCMVTRNDLPEHCRREHTRTRSSDEASPEAEDLPVQNTISVYSSSGQYELSERGSGGHGIDSQGPRGEGLCHGQSSDSRPTKSYKVASPKKDSLARLSAFPPRLRRHCFM